MFYFLSISNLNTSKGTFVLLDAAEILLKQVSDFHVSIVGAPTAEISPERMQQEIENRGLQKVVTYHGRQYGEDKEARFAEADCFVHPTLDDCFPLVILEAMKHALPVIATPVGAIPDMVIDGETGFIVNEQDACSLANSMMKIKQEDELSLRIGDKGRNRYQHLYTKLAFEGNLMTIIEE